MTPITTSSIHYNEELNCLFFASSVWRCLWELLIIQAIFPNDKKGFSKYEMELEAAQQPEAVQ